MGYEYDSLSVETWEKNYKAPNESTRKQLWERCAKTAASSEQESKRQEVEQKFYSLFENDKFVAGGRIMANMGIAGRNKTTLYNCYVHNPGDIGMKDPDSIEGIYSLLKVQAKTLQSEGGYGTNASYIRPAGVYIEGIGSRSPGVLKFMELWDKSSEIITMGSPKILGEKKKDEKLKIRKGAQMLVLNVWHPDIEEFIVAKQTSGRLSKFNMSVGITPGFMDAVKTNSSWELVYPDTTVDEYKTVWTGDLESWKASNLPVIVYKTVKAKELWEQIMTSTYNRAEPGVLNLDLANKLNPCSYVEKIAASNPCGEVVMPTGVCNLGSYNLPMYVIKTKNGFEFDFKSFGEDVYWGIRFLDNVNDISTTPLADYDIAVKQKRRIGLGVMGLGSLHFMLGIKYGSDESLKFIEKIFKLKSEKELLASALIGKEKGSFELFNRDEHFNTYWWKNLRISDDVKKEIEEIGCMRNSHQSMNAPTGNTGIYAKNVSGGIEPVFSPEYSRWTIVPDFDKRTLIDSSLVMPDISKSEWFETDVFKFSSRGNEQILKGSYNDKNYEIDKSRGLTIENKVYDYGWKFVLDNYSTEQIDNLISNGILATAQTLEVEDHTNVLEVIAHYTNQSNSKTINVPNDYSYEKFKNIYMRAYDSNIKGITTYREGTMTAVLEVSKEETTKSSPDVFQEHNAPKRPQILECDIHQVKIKGEAWTIFVGLMDGKPYEMMGGKSSFVNISKKIVTGRLVKNSKKAGSSKSIYDLHYGDDDAPTIIKDIVRTFENPTEGEFSRMVSLALRHGSPVQYVVEQLQKDEEGDLYSFSKVLSRVLKTYIKTGLKVTGKVCPECGSDKLIYIDGCCSCSVCSWQKCG